MTPWQWTDPSVVRASVAALALRDGTAHSQLGDVVLRDHQREAAGRLRHVLERFGGALLADDVGLGKTYTALAAARDASALLVIAPAALASMWRLALERSHVQAEFLSLETLSHRDPGGRPHDIVIVDEAHHARNPLTRRYERLATLTRDARVLLLSATPVHNASTDLHALLALFMGSRAQRLSPIELASCIVRRTRDDLPDATTPHREAPVWLEVDGSAETLRAVIDIPAPCPPSDGGDGGALIAVSLVRAWASTEAALRSALRRRIARADALADALAAGRHPTRAELRAWVVGDDATQLAFPEVMALSIADDVRALLAVVRRHADGVRGALAMLAAAGGAIDDERCALIRDIRRRHPGERIVVFSQFADSVHAMFSRLRADGRVAAVTAHGAWVTGGPLTRAEALARFAPLSSATRRPARAEAIELLIATDLLSEGLNLQDASVVVHLDLPWTAARLTQRLGRVWRIGSPHARVHEYALAPPAPAEEVLHLTSVLARKAGEAASAVGEALAPLLAQRATAGDHPATSNRARAAEQLRHVFQRWLHVAERSVADHSPPRCLTEPAPAPATMVAGVRALSDGWIAVVETRRGTEIIAGRAGAAPATDPSLVLEVASAASGAARVTSPSRVARVLRELDVHLTSIRAAADAGVCGPGSRTHAAAAGRIASVAAGAPPHRRVVVSRLAAGARRAVDNARSAGAERLLRALVAAGTPADQSGGSAESWLERVIELGGAPPPNVADGEGEIAPVVRALLLLVS